MDLLGKPFLEGISALRKTRVFDPKAARGLWGGKVAGPCPARRECSPGAD